MVLCSEPPDASAKFSGGRPRKRGPGQAAYERLLREGAHRRRPRRIFGYFLCEQKVTFLRFQKEKNKKPGRQSLAAG